MFVSNKRDLNFTSPFDWLQFLQIFWPGVSSPRTYTHYLRIARFYILYSLMEMESQEKHIKYFWVALDGDERSVSSHLPWSKGWDLPCLLTAVPFPNHEQPLDLLLSVSWWTFSKFSVSLFPKIKFSQTPSASFQADRTRPRQFYPFLYFTLTVFRSSLLDREGGKTAWLKELRM